MPVDAIFPVSCSLALVKWSFPLKKGGVLSDTPLRRKEGSISKLLSATTESPGSSKFNIPQSNVACLSLLLSANRSETNEIIPTNEIPNNPLAVLLFVVRKMVHLVI